MVSVSSRAVVPLLESLLGTKLLPESRSFFFLSRHAAERRIIGAIFTDSQIPIVIERLETEKNNR